MRRASECFLLKQKREWHKSILPVVMAGEVIVGVVLTSALEISFIGVGAGFTGAILAVAGMAKIKGNTIKNWRELAAMVLLVGAAGVMIGGARAGVEIRNRAKMGRLAGLEIDISGVIKEDVEREEGVMKFRLGKIEIGGEKQSGTIFVSVGRGAIKRAPPIKRADRVKVRGKMRAGFGGFAAVVTQARIIEAEREDGAQPILDLRDGFAEKIKRQIPGAEGDLALGYLLGAKKSLPKELTEMLKTVGLTHIVVASGANLAILVGFARKTLKRVSRLVSFGGAGILMAGFVIMVGFSPSMVRAGIVSGLTLVAGYYGRRFRPIRLLIIVAAMTLLYNPLYIFDLGWMLSFGSFTGIMVAAPLIKDYFYGSGKIGTLRGLIVETMAATLFCLPILLFYFGTFSILSLPANLLVLPTIPIVMGLSFLVGVCWIIPVVNSLLAGIATLILKYHVGIIRWFGAKEGYLIKLEPQQPWTLVLLVLAVGWLLYLDYLKRRSYYIMKT